MIHFKLSGRELESLRGLQGDPTQRPKWMSVRVEKAPKRLGLALVPAQLKCMG